MWREHDGPRATLGRPTWRQAAPFIAVGLVGLVAAVLPPYYDRPWVYAAMVASSLASFAFLAVAIRRPERSWVDGASAYATVVAIALMRDVTGGSSSALTGLAALPMLWLAVTGTRKELLTAILLTIGASVVPSLVVGAPEYNTDDWKRAVVLGLIALAVMPAVQKIVQDLARETRRASEAAAEMDDIMRGARLTSMVVLGVDGAIRQFSTGAEQLLGYRASEVVGRDGLGLLHDPDELAEAAAELGVRRGIDVFAALAAAGAPARIWTYNRKDGRTLHVRLAVTELHDGVGAVTGYLSVALDESSAVESERELALSEARWRVLTDHLPDLTVLMIDEEFRILVVSGAGAAAQGLRGKEGKHLADVSNPSNLEILGRLAGKAFAGREASGFLFANATGDEHEVIATPLPPDAAGTKRVLFLGRNLSVERSRERELLRANHRSERLFADAPHGVAVLDVAGVVLQANAALDRKSVV